MTTATLPRRLSFPRPAPPSWRATLFAFAATLLIGIGVLAGLSVALAIVSDGVIHPRVAVAGVDLGGLSRTQAEERLTAVLPSLIEGRATVVAGGTEAVVSYEEVGRGYDLNAMLDQATAVGRGADPIDAGITRLRSLLLGVDLPVRIRPFDPERMDALASRLSRRLSKAATDAAVTRDGTTFTVSPSSDGQVIDAAAITDAVATALGGTATADVTLELRPRVVEPDVTTAEAEAAAADARAMAAALELPVPGDPPEEAPLSFDAETIASWISFGEREGRYAARVDEAAAGAAVEALRPAIDREARNASFSLVGTGLGGVIAGAEGRSLNADASLAELLRGLASRASGTAVPSLALVVDVTQPALTTAAAEAAFPQMQLVSTWTTYYEVLEGNNWGANITIPARDIDGRVLAPGEQFEFWSSIGPVTPERGYGWGGAIINGRSVPNSALGGGMCSTSTTLFNAALRYGLQMGYRANHYYYITRYPLGLDATVFMSDSAVDTIEFTNDTPYPIVIRGFGAPGWVRFDLWSVAVNRSVVLTQPYVTNRRPATDITQVDPTMAPGTARRIEYPHEGMDVSVTRYVYSPDGTLLHQDTYFSAYQRVTGITLIGPQPPPPPPAEEAPPPEEPAPPPSPGP